MIKNYFTLFDLPWTFAVDKLMIQERYRQLHHQIHPDRFVNATAAEKKASMQYATLINDAYRTLMSPVKRAAYLLKLKNVAIDFEKDQIEDRSFLVEHMTLREALEQGDNIALLQAKLNSDIDKLIASLEVLFDNHFYQQAKEETIKLQFYTKLHQQLQHRINKL